MTLRKNPLYHLIKYIMRKELLILSLVLICLSCGSVETYTSPDYDGGKYTAVSFEQLSENPNQFDKKKIELVGIFYYGMEEAALTNKENPKNRIWIKFDYKKKMIDKDGNSLFEDEKLLRYSGKDVKLKGVFNKENTGHLGIYFAAIEDLDYFGK